VSVHEERRRCVQSLQELLVLSLREEQEDSMKTHVSQMASTVDPF